MSWIAISDGRRAIRSPRWPATVTAPLVPTGCIVVETRFHAVRNEQQVVLDLSRGIGWQRAFQLVLTRDGLHMMHIQGDNLIEARVATARPDRDAALRITLSWRAPERIGMLAVENLDTGSFDLSVFENPHPWPLDDIHALVHPSDECCVENSVTMLAVANSVEPVGLQTGFVAGTLINTALGPKPVEALRPGIMVQTSDNGMQPVRFVTSHEVPALGRYAPVRLRAPYFGLEKDLSVAPDHRLLITGTDAEYLFGADSVMVQARHLAQMAAAHRPYGLKTVRYVQVILESHVCLQVAGGAWGESLYLGELVDHPTRLATSALAPIPTEQLPRHTRTASPFLKGYEAMVLVSAMCA